LKVYEIFYKLVKIFYELVKIFRLKKMFLICFLINILRNHISHFFIRTEGN